MAAKFNPQRNENFALPVLFEKYEGKIAATKEVCARLNGGAPLAVVPEEWTDCWIVRFLIGFKEDPELAGKAFYDAQMWRGERGIEAIRQKMAAGLQPKDFPHAGKVKPFFPTMLHGRCRHGLPVEYNFTGFVDPPGLLKSASFEEILEVFIYDAEYKLNMLMTQSLERNVLMRLQAVFDGKGFAFSKHLNRKNIGVIKSVMDQITPRYVEMAEIVQIINCPFAAVVKQLVNHVVPERALHKFSITGTSWQAGVIAHIEEQQLHPCLQPGGPSPVEALGIKAVDTSADMEKQTVAAGKKVDLAVPVAPGSDIAYSFISEGHDVGLSIALELSGGGSVQVMPAERIHGDHKLSGGFPASLHGGGGGGTLKIVLDNSYSWTKKKHVRWQVENVAPVNDLPI